MNEISAFTGRIFNQNGKHRGRQRLYYDVTSSAASFFNEGSHF